MRIGRPAQRWEWYFEVDLALIVQVARFPAVLPNRAAFAIADLQSLSIGIEARPRVRNVIHR